MDVDIFFEPTPPPPATTNVVVGFFLLEDGVSYFLLEDLGRLALEASSLYAGNDN